MFYYIKEELQKLLFCRKGRGEMSIKEIKMINILAWVVSQFLPRLLETEKLKISYHLPF